MPASRTRTSSPTGRRGSPLRLPASARRRSYRSRLRHEVLPAFGDRVPPFDVGATKQRGLLMGEGPRQGAVPSDDAEIAAVAWLHGLVVVWANERRVASLGCRVGRSLG